MQIAAGLLVIGCPPPGPLIRRPGTGTDRAAAGEKGTGHGQGGVEGEGEACADPVPCDRRPVAIMRIVLI